MLFNNVRCEIVIIFFLVSLSGTTLSSGQCSSEDGCIGLVSNCEQNKTFLTLETNKKYFLLLDSNPSTGYIWKINSFPTKGMSVFLSDEVIYDNFNSDEVIVGISSNQKCEISFDKSGVFELKLEYSRPWFKEKNKIESSKIIYFEVKE